MQTFAAEGAWPRLVAAGVGESSRILDGRIGELVRETPGRRTWRFTDAAGVELYLKQYAPGSGRAGKVARLAAPARIEARRLLDLRAAGLPVPELLFACWSRWGGRGKGATIQVGHPGTGVDVLLENATESARERFVLERLAPLVRRLHAAGFYHRDLYSGHFVATDLDSDPHLIDVARVRDSPGIGQRLRVKDLAAQLVSLRGLVSDTCLLRAFAIYRGGVDLPARWRGRSGGRALLGRVQRKAVRIVRHVPRHDPPVRRA